MINSQDFASRGFAAFLFDMDGTLVNSHPVVLRVWGGWLRRHGLDVEAILPTVHGVRIADTVRRLAVPGLDPDEEARRITAAETEDVQGILPVAGAREFFHALPEDRRAIVTSATPEMALRRLAAAGIEVPAVLVTGRDVLNGKPAPDCFELAARRLGKDVTRCLVFEDAAAGIASAEAAGASVAVITETHAHPMRVAHPTLPNYLGLRHRIVGDDIVVESAPPSPA